MKPRHLILVLLATGCSSPAESPPDGAPPEPDASSCTPSDHILFLNANGGTYSPGESSDSSLNITGLVARTVTLRPYPYSQSSWNELVECVRGKFAEFDIEVTDVDPGDVDHMEVAFVDNIGTDLGAYDGWPGVAPVRCFPGWREIAFWFTPSTGDDTAQNCWHAGQLAGFMLGLDLDLYCEDFMSGRSDCDLGNKAFQDYYAQCGSPDPRSCHCGGQLQNSYKWVLSAVGEACPARKGTR